MKQAISIEEHEICAQYIAILNAQGPNSDAARTFYAAHAENSKVSRILATFRDLKQAIPLVDIGHLSEKEEDELDALADRIESVSKQFHEMAMELVCRAIESKRVLDETFVEEASASIYGAITDGHHYNDLSDSEREFCRSFVKSAIEICDVPA